MKILVTGGAGYIGSACTEYLLNLGYDVTVFDSLMTGHRAAVDKRAEFVKGDLNCRDAIFDVIKKGKFDGIMHFAAFSLVGESMTNPGKYFSNNLGAGINLLDAAKEAKVKKFVFSSTCAVYGEPEHVPIGENEKTKPVSPYGESKLMFEKALEWYHRIHGMEFVALRYFNASGATGAFGEDHNPETHLIPLVLRVALGKLKNIKIFGDDYTTPDGTCIRDYIHILDLAQAHELALKKGKCGFFNLGTGSGYSVKQIIEMSRNVTGHSIPEEIIPRRPGDPPKLVARSAHAASELGWKPKHENIKDIISSAWEWIEKHPEGYGDN